VRALPVPPDSAAARLDRFLAAHVPRRSRRVLLAVIASGAVRVNGRRARKGDLVRAGDVIEVPEQCWAEVRLQPNAELRVPVLYADTAVIALDKPAGMPAVALDAADTRSAANFLMAQYLDSASASPNALEAGIVHRLDNETSGILLAARRRDAYTDLRRQFAAGTPLKEYLAVVSGRVTTSGRINTRLAHAGDHMKVVAAPAGRPAETAYWPVEHVSGATLLRLQISTGVRHQIRIHLASVGHAILGDRLYGADAGAGVPRQLLHASRLVVTHPSSGQPLELRCAAPPDFEPWLAGARTETGRS